VPFLRRRRWGRRFSVDKGIELMLEADSEGSMASPRVGGCMACSEGGFDTSRTPSDGLVARSPK
jgi:cytochrome c5